MGFITSKRSSQLTNALPKIKSTSGKSYSSHKLNDASRNQCKNKDLDLRPKKKSEIEDIDLEKQLKVPQEMSKVCDCMWLSSDCNSLNSLVSDQSGEIWELSDSNLYGSSCSSLSTLDDSKCSICDSDRTSIWISSLDVNPKGTHLVQQKNDEVDFSYSDFSSPSHNSKRNSQLKSSFSSSNSSKASRSSSREFSEPNRSCVSVTPRMNGRILKSVDSKLSRNILQTPKKSTKTLVLSEKSTRKSTPAALHLSRSSPRHSSRLEQCNKESHQLKVQKQTQKQEELQKKHLVEFEDIHFHESLIEGVSIEKLIGLDEFDGHEGLDANFKEEFHFHL